MEPKTKTESYNNLGGINTKVSPYLTGPQEFLNLENYDFTQPGSLTKSPGTTLFIGATISGRIGGLYEFQRLNGLSQVIVAANTNLYYINGNLFTPVASSLLNNAIWSFSTFVDRLFGCNGTDYLKYDGAQTTKYSLPYGDTTSFGVTGVVGSGQGMSGVFMVSYGYFNERGYFGPGGPVNGISISLNGITFNAISFYGMTTPAGFGISGIALYCSLPGLINQFQATLIPSQATFTLDNGAAAAAVISTIPNPSYIYFTQIPRYLETYNNSLIMSGFSAQLSTVWFSDIGEPEGVDPTFNFQVRTNDGDRIYGQRAYQGSCIIFKERSFHRLSGDNPANYLLQEVSDQYGGISHRSALVWQDKLWFLDRKGICEYNGANTVIVSNKIEPIFLTMNIDAAKDQAVAIHNRLRNEVWFSFPVNGATLNNITVVYDYVAQGWTTFKGFMPSSLSMVRSTFAAHRAFFGSYSGSVYNFDENIPSYAGTAMTCVIKSRFYADHGKSIQMQYRRLFFDVDPVPAGVSSIQVNFMQDYGSSTVLTRNMGQPLFQSRIDFGVAARSLAFTAVHASATLPIRVHGWTIESRLLRNV